MKWLLLLVLLVLPLTAWAQASDSARQRVEVSADVVEGDLMTLPDDTSRTERVQRLTGNVRVRQGETLLTSRRAVRYLDRRQIFFFGNVVIVERGDTLRSPEVQYDERTKVGVAVGPLRLSDGEVVVTAPRGEYFTGDKRASFAEGVQLVDSATVLTSERGTYFSDDKRAEFGGAVRLEEPRSAVDADSVTYLRETKESFARGNVFIERRGGDDASEDSTSRTFLYGTYAYSDETRGFSRVEGDSLQEPLLVRVRADSTGAPQDTLLLRAPLLEAERVDSVQTFRAWGGMRLWSRDYAARADSAYSIRVEQDSTAREEVRLFREPVAWFDRVQVDADTLRLLATEGALDTLLARSNAFAAELDTVTNRLHQLKGQDLFVYFLPDSVRILTASPNAEIIRQQSKDGVPDGLVQASADRFVLHFKGDTVRRASIISGVESTVYAESIVPSGLVLDGLRYRPEERPTKADLLGAAVLPVLGGSAPPAAASEAPALPDDTPDDDS